MIRIGEMWAEGVKLGTALLVRFGSAWMTVGTAIAYLRMMAAAHADGVVLTLNSGWRSFEEQAALRAAYDSGARTAIAAKPGASNHQNGRALDIDSGGGTGAGFVWLTANAARFGFKRTVPSEPWHWEHRPEETA